MFMDEVPSIVSRNVDSTLGVPRPFAWHATLLFRNNPVTDVASQNLPGGWSQKFLFARVLIQKNENNATTGVRNYGSTTTWPFIPPWPIPQRLQQWNE